ncbi:unnamed protein product [Cuscuta epithymum]|uniref:Uncharacterized protein n=1 Tax=Cuscuta epithymum TaxID=186058 RepID=A0AAV0FUU8_9ASTE|nr:unnamed protein product [Cuscuta epithymum]CAH9139464.1 unnamed protein product [Cuscuta epithymum]
MAKGTRGRRRMSSRQCRPTPYPLPSANQSQCSKKCKKDWEDATCSVCMECPHNAVLLLCSSHDKGCRPYMCGTGYRYSNCLDQYEKANTKVKSTNQSVQNTTTGPILCPDWPDEKFEITELACPLCRGQVKGWTVVEPAREYLNAKKRNCMQDGCQFMGDYKDMRKHVKTEHPSARPHEKDPLVEQKWRRLEVERERDDVISTIRSSMPGAVVFGDYVIEGGPFGYGSDEDDDDEVGIEGGNLINVLRFLQAFGSAGGNIVGANRVAPGGGSGIDHNLPVVFDYSEQESDDGEYDNSTSLVGRLRRHRGILLGRAGRRRRHREVNSGGRR